MLKPMLIALLCLAPCYAQVDTGIVTGTLTDASGAAVAGIAVTITHTATGIQSTAVSSARGQFVSPPLRPGAYTVSAEAPGFKKSLTELTLSLNDRAVADMVLQIGAASEQVTVKATSPM